MKSILKAFFLVFLVAVSVQAVSDAAKDAFQQGLAAYIRGDYATALKHWRPLAEQGNAKAQNNLGVMYKRGQSVSQDESQNVSWPIVLLFIALFLVLKGRTVRDAQAQFSLGVMYDVGRGVPQDFQEAVRWYRKAAEQGLAEAQFWLGWMYANGQGVPQDDKEAVRWYRKAAEQGLAGAQNNLGWMYDVGRGVPQDDKEAVRWYRKAAEQGNAQAQFNLGWMYDVGRGVPQDDKEAARWYCNAAEQGHAQAQFYLRVMYIIGHGVPQDKVLAYALYNLSTATGPSDVSNLAPKRRAQLLEELTPAELEAGQALTRELMKPGNFAQALDAWQRR